MVHKPILLTLLDITRQTGNLEEYFAKHTDRFYLYLFPPSFVEKGSRLVYYEKGTIAWEQEYYWYRGKNKFLKTIFYYLYLIYIMLMIVPRKTIFITYQPLFCIGNSMLRLLKGITLVFVVGDYFPVRIDFMTKFYHQLTRYYMKHCHYVLLPSPMYEEVYKVARQSGQHRDEFKYAIKKIALDRQPVHNLVGYVGHVREGQGIEVIFEALRLNPQLKLEMIGHGQKLDSYKHLAKKKKIDKRVKFHGFVKDDADMKRIMNRWEIGLAVYDPSPSNLTYYTEPSKVKVYLQYQLPVIMTKITYISQELSTAHAGVCIEYDPRALIQAIHQIQKNYDTYTKSVKTLIEKYEFNHYYGKRLTFLQQL